MRYIDGGRKKPSEVARDSWVTLATVGGLAFGGGAFLGGLMGGSDGGGGDAPAGAPDWYYEHLVGASRNQAQMGDEMYNISKWGQPKDIPRAVTDSVRERYFFDGEEIDRASYEALHALDPEKRIELGQEGNLERQYVTQDDRVFHDREQAVQHSIDHGFSPAPDSPLQLEREQIASSRQLLPGFTNLAADELAAAEELLPQQTSLMSAEMGLRDQQISAEKRLLPQETGLRSAQIGAQRELLPQETGLRSAQIGAQRELLPQETGLRSAQIGAQRQLLPHETGLRREQIGAQRELLPHETGLRREQIGAQRALLPHETDLRRTQIGAEQRLTPKRADLEADQIAQARQTLPLAGETQRMSLEEQQQKMQHRAPLLRDFYQAAGNVDPNQYARRAATDVAQQYAGAQQQANLASTRAGARPGSGRQASLAAGLQTSRARDTAAAKTTGRQAGEQEQYRRLSEAVRT